MFPVLDADGAEPGPSTSPPRAPPSGVGAADQAAPPGQGGADPLCDPPQRHAEEDNLAENVPLHPLHQFRAFLALRERGQSEEENAAAFFVSVVVLKQRLRLASVSPKLRESMRSTG